MALEKVSKIDLIEIVENGCVQVRIKTSIVEDGTAISSTFKRYVIAPGDDYSKEDAKVQAVCAIFHTADVIQAFNKPKAA